MRRAIALGRLQLDPLPLLAQLCGYRKEVGGLDGVCTAWSRHVLSALRVGKEGGLAGSSTVLARTGPIVPHLVRLCSPTSRTQVLSLQLTDLQDCLQPEERMRCVEELMVTAVAQVRALLRGAKVGGRVALRWQPTNWGARCCGSAIARAGCLLVSP